MSQRLCSLLIHCAFHKKGLHQIFVKTTKYALTPLYKKHVKHINVDV